MNESIQDIILEKARELSPATLSEVISQLQQLKQELSEEAILGETSLDEVEYPYGSGKRATKIFGASGESGRSDTVERSREILEGTADDLRQRAHESSEGHPC